jgi:hypothetical protein
MAVDQMIGWFASGSAPQRAGTATGSANRSTRPRRLPRRARPDQPRRLGVCTTTVYKLCARGAFGHIRVLNAVRVPPKELVAFLARRLSGCTAAAYRPRKIGEMPHVRFLDRIRVRPVDLSAFIASRDHASSSATRPPLHAAGGLDRRPCRRITDNGWKIPGEAGEAATRC